MTSKKRDAALLVIGFLIGGLIHSQFFTDRPTTDAKLEKIAREACRK